jgi:hypothetical protein
MPSLLAKVRKSKLAKLGFYAPGAEAIREPTNRYEKAKFYHQLNSEKSVMSRPKKRSGFGSRV